MSRMRGSGQPQADEELLDQARLAPGGQAVLSAGNGAVTKMLAVQRLEQGSAYLGAVASYLNPLNQAARLLFDDLTDSQKALLDGIFGASLSTSIIRVNYNSRVASAGGVCRTTGNIINSPDPTIDDDTLIHEAAHVWQHQNGVPFMYAVSALRSQAIAAIVTGSRNAAYDYRVLEEHHVPWRYWNAEQQASWIEHNKRLPDAWWLDALQPDLPIPGVEADIPFG
jgi:hypothetical protein